MQLINYQIIHKREYMHPSQKYMQFQRTFSNMNNSSIFVKLIFPIFKIEAYADCKSYEQIVCGRATYFPRAARLRRAEAPVRDRVGRAEGAACG